MIEVSDVILCILNLELRCSENKISNLLNEEFVQRKATQLVNDYMKLIEYILNTDKIDLSSYQEQWRFPINSTKDRVATDFLLKGKQVSTYCQILMK